jgi:hypothetical protein
MLTSSMEQGTPYYASHRSGTKDPLTIRYSTYSLKCSRFVSLEYGFFFSSLSIFQADR